MNQQITSGSSVVAAAVVAGAVNSMGVKYLDFDEFVAQFRPIKNLFDPNASCDGLMFETYGPELEQVRATNSNRIWTLFSGDDFGDEELAKAAGYSLKPCDETDPEALDWYNSANEPMNTMVMGEGYHLVNRMGYFITEVPFEENIQYVILMDDDLARVAKTTFGK